MPQRLQDKIAVVTGASRGIGYALAVALAKEGAHIVAVARTVGGLEELSDSITAIGGTSTLIPLDLADFNGIDLLGQTLFERYGKLDILVGNAGILGQLSPLGHIDPKVWDNVFAVNVTANWRLIRSFDPLIRNSDSGRGIFLTSSAAQRCKPFWGAYSASHSALESIVKTYASEIENISNVKVNLVNPGAVRTALRAQAMPGEDPNQLTTPDAVAEGVLEFLMPECNFTGHLFDLPTGTTTDLRPPALVN